MLWSWPWPAISAASVSANEGHRGQDTGTVDSAPPELAKALLSQFMAPTRSLPISANDGCRPGFVKTLKRLEGSTGSAFRPSRPRIRWPGSLEMAPPAWPLPRCARTRQGPSSCPFRGCSAALVSADDGLARQDTGTLVLAPPQVARAQVSALDGVRWPLGDGQDQRRRRCSLASCCGGVGD